MKVWLDDVWSPLSASRCGQFFGPDRPCFIKPQTMKIFILRIFWTQYSKRSDLGVWINGELLNRAGEMDNRALSTTASQKLEHSNEPRVNNNAYLSRYDKGWRRIVRNFSPSWFSVTMGTGVCATILISIPWKADWTYYLSIIFFVLNTFIFFSAFTISALRYIIWYACLWVKCNWMSETWTNSFAHLCLGQKYGQVRTSCFYMSDWLPF